MLLGSSGQLKRNAFGKDPPNKAVAVDWSAMVKRSGLSTFLESVVNVLYHKGGASSLHHLLSALFGARYAGTPNTLRTVKSGQAGYGAIVTFPVYGASAMANYTLKNVLAMVAAVDRINVDSLLVLGQPRVFTVDGSGGRARSRRGKGELIRPVYVESEQESGGETDDEWS